MTKSHLVLILAFGTGLTSAWASGGQQAAAARVAEPTGLKDGRARVSYASGVTSVRNFKKNNIALDLDAMLRGVKDAYDGRNLALSEKDLSTAMNGLQTEIRRAQAVNHQELASRNRRKSDEFMAEFKKKEGVEALPNGVLYRVLKAGSGRKPLETDTVEVKYRGTKLDGTEFDATPEGKAASLRMNQTNMGWREALKRMPEGSRWQIVVPHLLAYGERGVGKVIEPNETLVFEVELMAIR